MQSRKEINEARRLADFRSKNTSREYLPIYMALVFHWSLVIVTGLLVALAQPL